MNQEVARLLDLAAAVPPARRAALLDRECSDPQVRAEVESLLRYLSGSEAYFEEAVQDVASSLRQVTEPAPGDAFGAYRIVSLIGRGGMGSVYLAERADGEIQHRVAVKLLHADRHLPVWRERFLTERQLLASLQHPSIIHVIDAGHTAAGRPFLVMEYIEGVPIDIYAAGLDVRRRLQLFLQVCEGVAHAHRCLIIHRDLKPSNILVDPSGRPKILDFGIAKLLDSASDLTLTAEQVLTPNYASPEQVAGHPQTTATDVYSLGVVLYRLLTGQVPRDSAHRAPGGDFTSPSVLAPDIPRDLDFIVRTALRPEPEERYASVDNFAADIRAALEWRPVQARSGDLWYRWRRFLRRYWVPVLAAGLVIASLAGGLYVADRQRAIAQRRFLDVRQLANKLFDIEVQVRKLPGATNVRQLIVDTSLEYLQRLSADARTDPALALETATAYTRVAHVQRYDAGGDSPRKNSPDQTLLKAQALIDTVLHVEPRNRIALLRSADIAQERMLLARHTRPDDALRFARETTSRLDRYLRAGNVDWKANRKEASEVIAIYLNLAHQYARSELFDETMYVSRRAVELARASNWPNYEGGALVNVAWANRGAGQLEEALQAIRGAVRILEYPPGERVPSKVLLLASALIVESQILADDGQISLGRFPDAIAPAERAVDLTRDIAGRDPNDFPSREKLASAATTLGNLLRHNDPTRALQLYDTALERLAEVKDNPGARLDEVTTLAGSAGPLQRLGRAAEARQRLDKAFERLKDQKVYPATRIVMGTEADDALRALARYEADAGNVRRAAELYQELLGLLLAGGAHPETSLANALGLSNLYQSGALVNRRAGLTDVADAWAMRRLELWQRWDNRLPGNAFVHRQLDAARAR